MFRNYFIVAFRNFFRNKVFSLINVSGLAIGISASLVIYLIVSYEFGFDKFEKGGNRIYRVGSEMHFPDQVFSISGVPAPLPAAIRKEISGIETVTGFEIVDGSITIKGSENKAPKVFVNQQRIIFADENYFKFINHQWLAGNPESLREPFKIVLAQSLAKTYFSSADWSKILGRTIIYNDSISVTVAGIVKDIDEITEFDFKSFISLSTISNSGLKNNYGMDNWNGVNGSSQCFVKLNPGISPLLIEKQIKKVKTKYLKNDYLKTTHLLQPLSDIHFNSSYSSLVKRSANKKILYGLLIVAAFLLLLGCINFINLTTAQAIRKAKETGIRKTMGSSKKQLIQLYLTETFLLTSIATLLSVLIAPALLKLFSDHIPKEISFSMVGQLHVLIFLVLLTIAISLLSGFYPAVVLTRYNPAVVLKSQASVSSSSTRKSLLRKSLTVTQFIVAQFFIIATLMVGKQIYYSLHKDLGYKKDAIIIADLPWPDKQGKYPLLLQKLKSIPGIEHAVISGAPPAINGISISTITYNGGKKKIETTVELKYADSAYFNLYHMKLLSGRYLIPSDSISAYMINNTCARFLGFKNPADAVGQILERGNEKLPIVGVLADVHTQSLHSAIKPLAYSAVNGNYGKLHIALKNQNENRTIWKSAISQVQHIWKEIYPETNFEYEFFDDSIAKFYTAEQTTATMLG